MVMDKRRQGPLVDESVVIAAPAPDVWHAVVVAEVRADWWSYLTLDASIGERFEERWTDRSGRQVLTSGVVTEVVVDRLLALRWADDAWPATTRVEIRLAEAGAKTVVQLLHSGMGGAAGWRGPRREQRAARFCRRSCSASSRVVGGEG